jgi:hypothetical protein
MRRGDNIGRYSFLIIGIEDLSAEIGIGGRFINDFFIVAGYLQLPGKFLRYITAAGDTLLR